MRRILTLVFAAFLSFTSVSAVLSTQAPTTQNQEQTKEQVVYVTKTGKKYHTATCRYLAKSKIPMSLKDAKAKGYTPCSVCKPPQ